MAEKGKHASCMAGSMAIRLCVGQRIVLSRLGLALEWFSMRKTSAERRPPMTSRKCAREGGILVEWVVAQDTCAFLFLYSSLNAKNRSPVLFLDN